MHELINSPVHLIDYIGAGTVFKTTSKADAEVTGLQWIKTLRCLQPAMPFTGIGGITVENSSAVIDAGADGVSVISAVTQASNIDRKSTRLNSSHVSISYAVFCLKKNNKSE